MLHPDIVPLEKGSKTYSFAVGSQYGPRSAKWVLSITGRDVYVTTSSARKSWKASLHESGRWHIKRLAGARKGEAPLIKAHRNEAPSPAEARGLIILIPDSSLRPASLPDPKYTTLPNTWFERPPAGGVAEITIMTWTFAEVEKIEQWPGFSHGTQLRIFYQFGEEGGVGVLTRMLPPDHPLGIEALQVAEPPPHVKAMRPINLNSPERRMYFMGKSTFGALLISEYAID